MRWLPKRKRSEGYRGCEVWVFSSVAYSQAAGLIVGEATVYSGGVVLKDLFEYGETHRGALVLKSE